jgi:RNA polymerase sigma-70 factor, ECF subfamily
MLSFYLSIIETQEDQDKFEQIYLAYHKLMKYVSFKILQDDYLAEDAVHNAFINIIDHLDKIDTTNCHKTKGFCIVVVENISKKLYVRRKKENTAYFEDMDEEFVHRGNMDHRIDEKINDKVIADKIGSLPSIYRDVLLLKIFHNCNDKEISRIMDIPPATVRKRLERARERMRAMMVAEG